MHSHLHLVIPDLFLPHEAAAVSADLRLPALETILARAEGLPLNATSLEEWLCLAFGVEDRAIAPVTLEADGCQPGANYWLRADPVHLVLEHHEVVLQANVSLTMEEAGALCATLNEHFAADGLRFVAPHPQRWYLELDSLPGIVTSPLSLVAGKDIHAYLPQGPDALRWHRVLNEIQMLLFQHPVNQAREERGEWPANGLWLWGGGYAPKELTCPFTLAYANDPVVAAFAAVAGIKSAPLPQDATQCLAGGPAEPLIVWDGLRNALQHGDLAEWRDSVEHLERHYASPLLNALRGGKIEKITLDVPHPHASQRFVLTRRTAWRFWRRRRRLQQFSA
jgi:hypothetical protein